MAYCTQSDLEKVISPAELVQLTDDDRDGVADTGVVAEAIAKADGEIESYLASRYTVPLSPVPVVIRAASEDIALWNLFSRRSIGNETREKRYKSAVSFLKDLAEGKATLGVTPAPAAAQEGGVETARDESERTFTMGHDGTAGTLDNY